MSKSEGPKVPPRGLKAEGVEHMFAFGVGSVLPDIRTYTRDHEAFSMKVRLDSGNVEALDKMMAEKGLEWVPVFVDGKVVRQDTFEEVRSRSRSGLQRFVDANPGVTVGPGPGPFLVAIFEDGHAVALDAEGNIIESMTDSDPPEYKT